MCGHEKKCANKSRNGRGNDGEGTNVGANGTCTTIKLMLRKRKIIRYLITCKRCSKNDHRKATSSAHSMGQRKRGKYCF